MGPGAQLLAYHEAAAFLCNLTHGRPYQRLSPEGRVGFRAAMRALVEKEADIRAFLRYTGIPPVVAP